MMNPGKPAEGDLIGTLFFGLQASAGGPEWKEPAHGHIFAGFRVQSPEYDAKFVLGNQIIDLEAPNHGNKGIRKLCAWQRLLDRTRHGG